MPNTPILIVDDDEDIRESLGDMLIHEGYQVQTAPTGTAAIQQVRSERYGAALLDIQLPDLNGLSVLKVMMDLDPDLPIIILTGNATMENTIGSLTRGAFAYLTKPYNPQELKAIVRRAVSMKGLVVRAEHVEQALRASEERFRALVESASDAIVLADHTGYMIWWNSAAERMFGYNKQEALGHSLTIIMPERFRQAHEAGLRRVAGGETPRLIGNTIELVGLTKNGQEFPLELSLASWHTKEGVFFSGIIRDITRRKQAEESVLRLSRQNALILDSAAEGIFGMDVAGQITFINVTGAGMLNARPEELIGRPVRLMLDGKHQSNGNGETTSVPVYAALQDGTVHRIQNDEFVRRDGTAFPVEYVTSPIHEDGRLMGAVVVFQDISDRKLAESRQHAQLAISHILAQLDSIEAVVPELLRVVGEMGGWDLGLFWQTGAAPSSLLCSGSWIRAGLAWNDFVSLCRRTELPSGIDIPWEAIQTNQPIWLADVQADARFTRTPTASRLGLRGSCAIPIKTGHAGHVVLELFSRDARQPDSGLMQVLIDTGMKLGQFLNRARAAQALRTSHEMTQQLLASLPGAILLCDRTQRIHYANALAHQYFNVAGRALVGQPLAEELGLSENARQQLRQEWSAILSGQPPASEDHECDSERRLFRYRLFLVPSPTGMETQVGMVLWDITEQKQLQDQLIQAEKLSSLGTMVSGMAHEINNPAQAILSMAELIQEEDNPASIKEFASDIVGYARHVSTVVRDFASYARSAGRDGDTEIDLAERLLEAVKMVRRGPAFGYIDVVTEFEAPAFLRARKGEIDQVFVNVISNAAQAMNGSGRLTLSTDLDGSWLEVRIADTGPGIPKHVLPKIFDPFFTTKEAGKGTGLGLSIVHKIVTKYDGTVTVDTSEGQGTTFRLRFPALFPEGGSR
jgi:PAS domain S-box-containing protein